ncbi:unnamed protein product [Prunus armeniaca]
MEFNITTCENFVRLKIIKFEGFLTKGITKENRGNSTRSKFMCHMNISGICKTTKNTEVRERRFFGIKMFKRGVKRKKRSRKTVDEMNCS